MLMAGRFAITNVSARLALESIRLFRMQRPVGQDLSKADALSLSI